MPVLPRRYSTDNHFPRTRLFLSRYTAKNYRTNLLLKLDVKNTAGLIRKAMQLGLVT
jgi:DNA-binding NarL/FixJ family response regulator